MKKPETAIGLLTIILVMISAFLMDVGIDPIEVINDSATSTSTLQADDVFRTATYLPPPTPTIEYAEYCALHIMNIRRAVRGEIEGRTYIGQEFTFDRSEYDDYGWLWFRIRETWNWIAFENNNGYRYFELC